jgi:hypothetical protein
MTVAEDWHIGKSAGVCCRCSNELPENRLFFSCLTDSGAEFQRQDLCVDCWEDRTPENLFCFWRTRRPAEQKKQVVDTGLMMEFFDRLERADTDEKKVFRFVLALYLMRRKELKLLEIGRGRDAETLVFSRRSSGDKVEVTNPGLSEDQIQETAGQLSELLNAGLSE